MSAPVLQPIATAPDLVRIMVAGWHKPEGSVRGYWWHHEDVAHDGMAIERPHATHWFPIVLPAFPKVDA